MQLKLKNASRLASSIETEIQRLKGKISRVTQVYNTKEDAELNTFSAVSTNLEVLGKLLDAKFFIRNKIGEFNQEKINVLTAEIAKLQEQKEALETAETLTYSREGVNYSTKKVEFSSGLSEEQKELYHVEVLKITRQIQRLKDKCAGINSQGTVVLPEDIVSVLVSKGLLD